MTNIYLHGIQLANYKGVGPSLQRIGPFSEINFFIGPNNSGKSTALAFIANQLQQPGPQRTRWNRAFSSLDKNVSTQTEVRWGFSVEERSVQVDVSESPKMQAILKSVLELLKKDNLLWLEPTADRSKLQFSEVDYESLKNEINSNSWRLLWNRLTGGSGGSLDTWIIDTLGKIVASISTDLPAAALIPAIREVSEKGMEFSYSGTGLIDKLAELQNPLPHEQMEKAKFEKINGFLRAATDSPNAQIEIPHDRQYIMVQMDNRVLPLASLGTGIHEVIMLASFCTLLEERIVCIEEPEIHLHPLLQRKLMQYLRDNTSNQYFIATHSAALIDSVSASVIAVDKNIDTFTTFSLSLKPNERHLILQQLGYRASDLLQANCIIWVEGPSDRIYLRHWIRGIDPSLNEGIDYSVMFYGGRLLSHLSALDPEVSDFISLARLNRNTFVVIDSDKRKAHAKINDTKKRISVELGARYTWITEGREIENYLSDDEIEDALKNQFGPKFSELADADKYGNRLSYVDDSGATKSNADKVKVARHIAGSEPDLNRLDLRKQVTRLVSFIQSANHSK